MNHPELFNPLQLIGSLSRKLPLTHLRHRVVDLPVLLKQARIPRGASVLEVGCGTGRTSMYLAKACKCKRYTAVDIDKKAITEAESRTQKNTKIIFQVADVCRLPFDDNSFDAVVEMGVLHHMADWKKAIHEIHRVLRHKGKLLIQDFSIETFTLPGLGIVLQHLFHHPYDFMYDQIEFLTYLRKNGFDITYQNDSFWNMVLVATCEKKK